MNVFVLCTGRCGSLSLAKACGHITNFTVGHETLVDKIGHDRVAYPDQHIEIDNRLAYFLGRLDAKYGTRAFYVHLMRDEHETALSFERRTGIMDLYSHSNGIFIGNIEASRYELALDYVRRVNENIVAFLLDKLYMNFHIENYAVDFARMCLLIGASVDYDAAMAEFVARHNASGKDAQ